MALAAWLVWRGTQSLPAAVLSALALGSSEDLLAVHTQAWSEPLYIAFSVATLAMVAAHFSRPGKMRLPAAAALTAAAILTRYVGIALAAAGAIAIWASRETSLSDSLCTSHTPRGAAAVSASRETSRRREAARFALISLAPFVIWMAWNTLFHRNATDRQILYHPITMRHLGSLVDSAGAWLIPVRAPREVRLAAVAAAAVISLAAWYAGRRARRMESPGESDTLIRAMLIYAACYLALLAATILFVDWDVIPDERYLSPLFVCAVIGVAIKGHRALERMRQPSKLAAAGCLIALALGQAARGTAWARETAADGQGFASETWRDSAVVRQIAALPAGVLILTNRTDAIHYLTGHASMRVAERWDPNTAARNVAFESECAQAAARLAQAQGYLAWFRESDDGLPDEAEIARALRVRPLLRDDCGALFRSR